MTCYRPLKAFKIPGDVFDRDENGDFVYDLNGFRKTHRDWVRAVRSNNVIGLHLMVNGKFQNLYKGDIPDIYDYTTFDYIPCRKCYGCREDSAKMWTDRLLIEYQNHEQSWFLTLTYDDQHLPYSQAVDKYGVMYDDPTLRKKDLQDFFKRLRSYYDSKAFQSVHGKRHLMYYAAGEYGFETKRPHYHAIVFDLFLDDLQEWKRRDGFIYYSSKILEDIWSNGFVSVAKVNRETCAYTCRYVMKKAMGDEKEVYLSKGLEPEFQLMSKRPAIARTFYDENVSGKQDRFYVNKIHYLTGPDQEPISFNIPRYFDLLTEKENSDIILSVKEKRKKVGRAAQKLKELQSSKPYEEILLAEEANKISSNINFRNSSGGKKL